MRGAARYILFALLAFSFARTDAQFKSNAELSVSMEQFRLVSAGDQEFRLEALDFHYYYPEDPGGPALPLRSISVLVPNGAELLDFSYTVQDSIVGSEIDLERVSLPVPMGLEPPQEKAKGAFNGSFPDQVLSYSSTMIQRGYTWFSFTFSPFIYDSETRELKLVQHISLELSYSLSENGRSALRPDGMVASTLRKRVLNAGDMEKHYPEKKLFLEKSSGEAIDYLIITAEELLPAFMPLLEWKNRKGLNAEIITVNEIAERYHEARIQLSIKRYLYDRYVNDGLKWVLMGGDHDVVPVQGCFSYVLNGSIEVTDEAIPTDLFYACFDKRFDWNALIDDKIGQVYHDDNDLVPEIYLSRIPVRNEEEVRVFVNKTLHYEQQQPARGFSDRMLLAGVKTWTLWSGKSDSHHRSELMYENYISKYWDGEMVRLFDTGTDFSGDKDYQVSTSNLSEQLNKGFAYFHFSGHGDINTLLMEEGPRFDVNDASRLSNTTSGVILSNACDVNAFDSIDPCLSEAFLRNPKGGGVAFFGSSRLGFGLPDMSYSLGPSFQYNASFLGYLFSERLGKHWNSFATVASAAKSEFANIGSSGGTYLYLLYAINPLGDPELPLFTRNPSRFSNVRLYMLGKDLRVNTDGISDCRICLSSLDLDEGYKQVVQNVSNYTFKDIPEAFQITITAPNYLPYIYTYGSPTAVQDELESQIRIYPNPVLENLFLDFNLFSGKMKLYDIQGRFLAEKELVNGSNNLSMSAYPAGTYLLNVLSDKRSAWYKVVRSSK